MQRRSNDNDDGTFLTIDREMLLAVEFKTLYGLMSRVAEPIGAAASKRLSKELADIRCDPPSMVSLGPIHDEDMVC